MPAVKVFNIFGGQRPAQKTNAPSKGAIQKFYRTFSLGSDNATEQKGTKVSAIAASLEKKIVCDPKSTRSGEDENSTCKANFRSPIIFSDDSQRLSVSGKSESLVCEFAEKGLPNKTKGYPSLYENIVINSHTDEISISKQSKLNKALETFDKILSEFSGCNALYLNNSNNTDISFVPPKLQKSKTCSIIESRCILKDPQSTNAKSQNKLERNNSIGKTTSLWNLDDMKEKELITALAPLNQLNTKQHEDKYATYKVSKSNLNNTELDVLRKLDVKNRILKKTISNPPSVPVPVVKKPKSHKVDNYKFIDQNRNKFNPLLDKNKSTCVERTKNFMQKAKSVWEVGTETEVSSTLERTKSSTSITGSYSKIPVIRSQMTNRNFSSTRALFSPTPADLKIIDHPRECVQKNNNIVQKKHLLKPDIKPQVKQKSLTHFKQNLKLSSDKTIIKKEIIEKKCSSKPASRDLVDEIDSARHKRQQKPIDKKRDIVIRAQTKINSARQSSMPLSPVKNIIKKLELKSAIESKADATQYISCKVMPPVHKEICVANATYHNHLSELVGRQIKRVAVKEDTEVRIQTEKLASNKSTDERISDTHSDCSDDSGHGSNDAGNDNEAQFDHGTAGAKSTEPYNIPLVETKRIADDDSKIEHNASKNGASAGEAGAIGVASGTGAGGGSPKADEQILFRGGVIGALDARRDAALRRVLVALQARSRGVLARRRAARLRVQAAAARCIQRNVRAFLAVRDWPWWRLLVRVTPLLHVHRTEHQLKEAQEELETLRGKLEKVENERTHYRNETERLETKLSEVGGELSEERAVAAHAAERADAEAAERLRVERDNHELLASNQRLQQASERLELEVLQWRSTDGASCDGGEGGDASDSEGSEGARSDKYRRRWEGARRELQLLRAQLRRQHDDDLDQLVTLKKQLEKKVQDAYEEAEEQRAAAAQWKRKLQKLTNDMADLKSLLDEQTCRNNLLEKRQRKVDADVASAQEEARRERAARERAAKDLDAAVAEKLLLEQQLAEAKLELETKEERLHAAQRELEELGGGGVGGDEVAALRRARADLERRVREQDDELDDLAATVQMLESSKLRLEMLLEQQRKEARLEAAARDDELEEARASYNKKLKILESQVESEAAERGAAVRERHELERRLAALEDAARAQAHDDQQLLHRLKRDVKRYRALLRDAQSMLEQKEKEGGARRGAGCGEARLRAARRHRRGPFQSQRVQRH